MAISSSSIITNPDTPSIESSELFVSCLPGLETSLVREIKALGIKDVKAGKSGAMVYNAGINECQTICYLSRLSLRVLWKIHKFRLWKQQNLYQQAIKQPWTLWLGTPAKTMRIDMSGKSHVFSNTLFALQRLKDAICDHYREKELDRPNIDKDTPEVRLHMHLEDEAITFYIDMSGEPLNQRGYRHSSVQAPLNEVAAASLLNLAGYDGFRPFCDPCAGSGTLMIEAAMLSANIPAGKWRQKWGFQLHPLFDKNSFTKWREEQDSKAKALEPGWVVGCEMDYQAIESIKRNTSIIPNLENGLFAGLFQKANFTGRYVVVTNPPYGQRLQPKELFRTYKDLGEFLKKYASRAFIVGPEPDLIMATELDVLQTCSLILSGNEVFLAKLKTSKPNSTAE
jgi:putative N6-adenine-specific DNA methylase